MENNDVSWKKIIITILIIIIIGFTLKKYPINFFILGKAAVPIIILIFVYIFLSKKKK